MSGPPPDLPPEINFDPLLAKRAEFGGLSAAEAIKEIALSLQELNAKLAVQPLPGKLTLFDNITKIAEAVGNGLSKINFGGGGNDMEKRAVQLFFDMGQETMRTQVLTNRALQRRLGGDLLASAPQHVVVQG